MSELIKVFKYDDNGIFERDDLIVLEKGEKIPDGYTLIEPPVPAINPVFNTKSKNGVLVKKQAFQNHQN